MSLTTDMATLSVEAQSLSDITQLASNPPKYPRNPTEQQRRPLTLYIARVPGSRDIILTTLRPQLKNVTAEDVASSLYYLHYNTAEDLRFLNEDRAIIPEETAAEVAASERKPLSRKPLPETARSSIELKPLATPQSRLSPNDKEQGSVGGAAQAPIDAKHTIPRRPLEPRPQRMNTAIERKPLASADNSPSTSSPLNSPLNISSGPTLYPRLSNEAASSSRPQDMGFVDSYTAQNNSPQTFSITLIRRDPSSSAQWNIGSISGHPTLDEVNDRRSKSPSKKPYFDISIQLTNPGYTPFRNSQSPQDATRGSLDMGRSRATSVTSTTSFDREIRMEGSSFWARASAQHNRSGSDPSTARGRSSSANSASETMRNLHSGGEDPSDTQPKGYVFVSPWGGRCKFATGGGGRTLRCKHTLPGPSGAAESLASAQAAATLSELRFNLPGSEMFASATDALKKEFKEGHFKEKLKHFRQKLAAEDSFPALTSRPSPTSYAAMYPSDDEAPPLPPRHNHPHLMFDSSDEGERPPLPQRSYAEDDDRLDLSLGQEKAGGGNRGKRAKLGKLIIHDEGFKMLDLVIAANMGIWWSVWESEDR